MTFWLDTWVAKTAPVDRIKVEPDFWVSYANDWFTYPMEVRVLDAVLPTLQPKTAALPPVTERSDATLMGPLRSSCGGQERSGESGLTGRALIRRNLLQILGAQKAALNDTVLKSFGFPYDRVLVLRGAPSGSWTGMVPEGARFFCYRALQSAS